MPQSYSSLYYHLVFSTKYRRHLIDDHLRDRLYPYLGGVLRKKKCRLLEAGGIPDHVHLLASLRRDIDVSAAARLLKSNSTGWVHRNFGRQRTFAWQTGFAVFSVSYSHIESVRDYIRNQEKHHRETTFEEELLRLLELHYVEFDERFLLD